jgi:hypothetical protein
MTLAPQRFYQFHSKANFIGYIAAVSRLYQELSPQRGIAIS